MDFSLQLVNEIRNVRLVKEYHSMKVSLQKPTLRNTRCELEIET